MDSIELQSQWILKTSLRWDVAVFPSPLLLLVRISVAVSEE